MWNFLVNLSAQAWTQVVALFLFGWYFFAHRKDPRMVVSRMGLVHLLLLSLVFFYLLLSWASGVRPALAQVSVFGMFLINLYLLDMVVLSRLERPYRVALEDYCRQPGSQDLDDIWRTGKRFYYLRYFHQSLFSGVSPFQFLREVASSRIRDDVQEALKHCVDGRQFISLEGIMGFLEERLNQDETLPQEFRHLVIRDLRKFGEHPWVKDQVNEYLRLALESPESLHNPQWARWWEQARKKGS
jgi:hypothetical protein